MLQGFDCVSGTALSWLRLCRTTWGVNDIGPRSIGRSDNSTSSGLPIRNHIDLSNIWQVRQLSSLVPLVKVSFLPLLELMVACHEIREIGPLLGQFLSCLRQIRKNLSSHQQLCR